MEYFKRLGNFWVPDWKAGVWLLFALPALYFFQTTIHEGTHALAAAAVTGTLPTVAPFPHRAKNLTTGEERFLNGVTLGERSTTVTVNRKTNCNNSRRGNFPKLAGFPALPQFVALLLTVTFAVIFFFTTFTNPFARFPLRVWYFAACIDFMFNTARHLVGGCKEAQDWSKFFLESDMSGGVFALMTWILWLVILSHFVWVYWSGWGRETVPETSFWDYRWIAFALGILSFFAVLLSIFVGNDEARIIKGSAEFIVPFVFQIAALCWYWIYFGLTFKYKS